MPTPFGGRGISRGRTPGSSYDGSAPVVNPISRARGETTSNGRSPPPGGIDSHGVERPGVSGKSRNPSPGLFSLVGLAQPTLDIQLAEDLLFLHPAAPEEISDDPVVQGTVTLYLPKKRNLTHLSVKLVGRQDISWGDSSPYESSITLDKEVSLLAKGQDVTLEKGYHRFEFEFLIPSSTPTSERCVYGRVRYTIVAKAKGLGQLNGDISSVEKQLFLVVNPGGAGDSRPPPPLDHRHEGVLDEIGPYTMALQSQHIMVGGLLLLRFHLISPPTHLVIYAIKVKINQYFNLNSPSDPKKTAKPPVDVKLVMHLDGAKTPNHGKVEEAVLVSYAAARDDPAAMAKATGPLKILQPEEEYKIHHLARLPNDSVLRPSTPIWNNASIRVRHEIVLEMTYRVLTPDEIRNGNLIVKAKDKDDKGKERIKDRRKLVVSKPFEIFSCTCFVDSLSLPAYTLVDPNLSPSSSVPKPVASLDAAAQQTHHEEDDEKPPPCVCGFKFRQVIKYHGQELLREPGEEGVTYAPLVKDDLSPVTTPNELRGRLGGRNPFFSSLSPTGSPTGMHARLSPGSTSPPPLRQTSSSSLTREVFDLSLGDR